MDENHQDELAMISRRKLLTTGCALIAGAVFLPKVVLARPNLVKKASEKLIHFYNTHTGEFFKGVYWINGHFIPEALSDLNYLLRDWRTNEKIAINPKLFDMLHKLSFSLGTKKPLEIICGYRTSQTNEKLRQAKSGIAKRSRHLTGDAIDFRAPGIDLKDLRKAALLEKAGGVGYYPKSGFIHVDIRDKPASW
ncbi:MAG: YcbK family protein [Alphaproteobacteria bacterium]|nr:YcbK family protein [Alphaproteobacteria bacterium]